MLITEEYRAQNAQMHREKPHYGNGARMAEAVANLARWNNARSILDYGCGKGALKRALPLDLAVLVHEYDPAIPGKETASPAEVVVCSDVLEHIEPECLDAVLADLRRLTQRMALLLIALVPANKHLPDGRNAHLIVETADWWRERIDRAGFTRLKEVAGPDEVMVMVA